MIFCARLYRAAGDGHMRYGALLSFGGVPATTVLIARGRQAWEVSEVATEFLASRGRALV